MTQAKAKPTSKKKPKKEPASSALAAEEAGGTPERQNLTAHESKYVKMERDRTRYRITKLKAFELEDKNTDSLILFLGMNGYWKMGGISAMEFYHFWAQKTGYPEKRIRRDDDFFARFQDGVLVFHGWETIDERLKEQGLKLRSANDDIRIYALGYEITPERIAKMRNEQEILRKRANQNVASMMPNAELFDKLGKVIKITHQIYVSLNGQNQKFIGGRLFDYSYDLLYQYTLICWQVAPARETYDMMMRRTLGLLIMSRIMIVAEMYDLRKCVTLYQDLLCEVRILIQSESQKAAQLGDKYLQSWRQA